MAALRSLLGGGIAIILLVAFLYLPAVSYTVSFADPHNVDYRRFTACQMATNGTDSAGCLRSAALPPTVIQRYGSLSYYLFGEPMGPFPQLMLAGQGNQSYLLHFSGGGLSFMEGPFSGTPVPDLNPAGVIRVDNISIAQWAFGLINFSTRLTNVGKGTIWGLTATFEYPGYGTNSTFGTVRGYQGIKVACREAVPAGGVCAASVLANQTVRLLANQFYTMTLEVQGRYASDSTAGFLYLDSVSMAYPGVGLNSQWVAAFIQAINVRRNGTGLTENRTLDEFAAFRFNTLRAQYQVSDYNFTQDYYRYFGPNGPGILEEILYPNGRDPGNYPDYLKVNAPGHYGGLLDPVYTQFGYFFGSGPSIDIGPGCQATEIPGPNINITQFVIDHGCTYVIADEVWFIIVLGS